ncbi:transglycosylase domain-containing protein [Proteinivorax hydrogeniformans]|uniref:Penicillin-binding protein 1A n=1 Tax=Proteinivorax hydrogeniformans TaxID=1826727 RepID=A0AAU8HRF1_9FIRM
MRGNKGNNKSHRANTDNQKQKNKSDSKFKPFMRGTLKVLKVCLIIGILGGFLGAGVAFGMVVASIHDVPDMDRDRLEVMAIPSTFYDTNNNQFFETSRDVSRVALSYDEVPQDLKNAFLAAEDQNFYSHPGFDITGLGRAAVNHLTGQPMAGGGSTITQQLTKQVVLRDSSTNLRRKIQELYLALQAEKFYTKEEIFEFYMNGAVHYRGNTQGVGAAANDIFGKTVDELTLGEIAIIAGAPNLPYRYTPTEDNKEGALQRRNHVLRRMYRSGFITAEERDEAMAEEIKLASSSNDESDYSNVKYPGFVTYIRDIEGIRILQEVYGWDSTQAENEMFNGGFKIYTTLDPKMQEKIENIMNNSNEYLAPVKDKDDNLVHPQGSATMINHNTGELVALFPGRNHTVGDSVRPAQSSRQPGSAIKPILSFAPGFENKTLTPGTVLDDAPIDFGGYTPENWDRRFRGLITSREALSASRNVPAVSAFWMNTRGNMAFAEELGLDYSTSPEAVLALGTRETTAIQLTQAYGAFANEGMLNETFAIKKIEDRNGRVVYEHNRQSKEVMSEQTAYLVTDSLRDAITPGLGTAGSVRNIFTNNAAAKTGTSSMSDGWLVGYTPHYTLGVWMGWDRNEGSIGSSNVVGTWARIMRDTHSNLPNTSFNRPSGLVSIPISTKSGKLPSDLTPSEFIRSHLFLSGTEPTEECDAFVEVEVCKVSGLLATDSCPPHHRETKVMLQPRDYLETDSRWELGRAGRVPEDISLMAPEDECDMHDSDAQPPSNLGYQIHGDGIEISWSSGDSGDRFNIYRSSSEDSEFTKLNTSPIRETHFLDTNVSQGVTYRYYVTRVRDEDSETRPSDFIEVEMHDGVQAVKNISAEKISGGVRVTFEESFGARHYRIYRSTSADTGFERVENARANGNVGQTQNFTDNKIEPGNTYYYYVVAVSGNDKADPSPTAEVKVLDDDTDNGDDASDDESNTSEANGNDE